MRKHVYIRLYEACGHNKLCPYKGCPLMFMKIFIIPNSRNFKKDARRN